MTRTELLESCPRLTAFKIHARAHKLEAQKILVAMQVALLLRQQCQHAVSVAKPGECLMYSSHRSRGNRATVKSNSHRSRACMFQYFPSHRLLLTLRSRMVQILQ